ncbi:MAG: CBS domain-containing protein [Planctomycetales bacterium]|nr:CBS domain-containing protein [Planctomycetales bacterium]MCA9169927.1 CBS domain-containing protein [Planctomycetales bacterium]
MSKNPYELRVRDVMSRDLVAISNKATLHDCLQRMIDHNLATLPVVTDANECVGIVSATDMLHVTREVEEDLHDLNHGDLTASGWLLKRLTNGIDDRTVADVMTEDVAMVGPDTRLSRAATEMLRNRVHHLPVIDVREHVVGIISMSDVVSAFVDGDPHTE